MSQSSAQISLPGCPSPPKPDTFFDRLPGELAASITIGVLLAIGFVASYGPGWIGIGGYALIWGSLGIGFVYGGRAALEALVSRRFDIDVLMVLAAGLAAAVGHPEDGALLLFLFILAGALEERAMRRTMLAVEALSKLMPTRATVWRPEQGRHNSDGTSAGGGPSHGPASGLTGSWVEVEPGEVRVGERLWIRTGELIPCDARVEKGTSSLDQATLTGESVPRSVQPGDDIFAGTVNVGNPIEAVAMRPAQESSLQKILNLVLEAQAQREPLQRIIDRLSQPYAVGVVVVSAAVLLGWWLVFGFELITAAYVAIALLIIASPCALIIATPTATLAAISRAARAGVLFKGGQSIERLARMGTVCLDKTGTLTLGRPQLQEVNAVGWSSSEKLLAAAAALESGSTHPIAVAVVEAAKAHGVQPVDATDLEDLPGRGIAGKVEGRQARLGTYEHCEEIIPACLRNHIQEVLEQVRREGQLGVVVALDGDDSGCDDAGSDRGWANAGPDAGQAGVLILSDAIRPGSRELVEHLHELGVQPVRMLTGDNRITAAHVARELGIDEWEAELLPEDKVRIMQELRRERNSEVLSPFATLATLTPGGSKRVARGVGVIGDGVNDAPALAAADVSVAIGSIGSDAALETADIVLLSEDLTVIPWAVRLARRTRAVVLFNLILALSIIVVMGLLTLALSWTGWVMPLPAAVVAHEGGTLLVVLNSLRLLMAAPPMAGRSEPSGPVGASGREDAQIGLAA